MKAWLVFFAASFVGSSDAAERLDDIQFYSSRPAQLFKDGDIQEFSSSFEPGDDVPYWTWNGQLSGKKISLELHGKTINLRVGATQSKRDLGKAVSFPGDRHPGLHPHKIDIFVKSGIDAKSGVICVESLVPFASKAVPFREAYIFTNLLRSVRIYKMPERNASCRGVERDEKGDLFIPKWDVVIGSPSRLLVQYYRLGPRGFVINGRPIGGEFVSPDEIFFKIDEH